jgi:hypothetical protein
MATGRVPTTANSPLTAKGDLFGYSTTQARVAVGNDGETLVADSSTSTGLRYQTGVNTNAIINGGMDIWQRGTSIAASSSAYIYTVDRYNFVRGGFTLGSTVSRQSSGLTGFNYSARVQRDSGNTSTAVNFFQYTLETADSLRFAGQTVTFSFYAKAGANYSSASNILTLNATYGTGTDQAVQNFTGATGFISQNATLTTSWQRFTYTATVNAAANEIGFVFANTPVGTAGANDWYEITGLQFELGSVATNFKRAGGGTLQGELAACQRYYQRYTGTAYGTYALAYATSTTNAYVVMPFQTQMRTAPTVLDYASLAIDLSGTSASAVSVLAGSQSSSAAYGMNATTTGLTAFRTYDLCNNNTTSGYIGFGAEL